MNEPSERAVMTEAGRPVRPVSRRSSFTLIELLVVVAIILVLIGIVLRVTGVVGRQGGKARTLWVLEQVKNALGAYYTTYGSYPPVDSVTYILPKTDPNTLPAIPDGGFGYSTGLVYYIFTTDKYHNQDRDALRWQHYLEDVDGTGLIPMSNKSSSAFTWVFWTNAAHYINDAWGRSLYYKAEPPDYQRYRLWSAGPNGVNENGGGDDIGVTFTE